MPFAEVGFGFGRVEGEGQLTSWQDNLVMTANPLAQSTQERAANSLSSGVPRALRGQVGNATNWSQV